jgi:hypothetical protein
MDGIDTLLDKAAEMGEKFQDFVVENMDQLERVFNLPII